MQNIEKFKNNRGKEKQEVTNRYKRAYTEVLEILRYLPKEEYCKIPKEKIDFYKENMDKNYIYSIDSHLDLSKQYISEEANAILISLFRDYFATEKQRQTLNNLLNQNQEKLEKEKTEKYNYNDIFKREINEPSQNSLIKIQEISFIQKIVEKVKKFLHIG